MLNHCVWSGLKYQALDRIKVAAAPCNALRWCRPTVVFHFGEGCEMDVADELCAMGATISGAC